MPSILDGIRVFDFSIAADGPWASKLLGELGADVIKAESPDGELSHAIPPPIKGTAVLYISANFNKRNIVLDLKEEGDLGPVTTHAHDYGILVGWTSRKLTTTGSRLLSRCRAARSASPIAPCSPPSCLSPRRAANGAGCRPALATGPPLHPAHRWSQTGVLDRVFERRQREQIVRLTRAARSLASPLVQVPPAGTGARKQPALNPSAAPEAAGPPRCIGLPRMTARRSSARARLGPPPAPPALLRGRASAGDQTRHLAVALGYAPVGPPRRSRGETLGVCP